MFTPYDWQESISNRSQFIEERLSRGMPVTAASLPEGILLYSRRRQATKIYEVYDRIALAAVGAQADVESFRLAALEFATREGFSRSPEDVTLQRVIATMSGALRKAYGELGSAPISVRCLFAEVGETVAADHLTLLDFDGDFSECHGVAAVGATLFQGEKLETALKEQKMGSLESGLASMRKVWDAVRDEMREGDDAEDGDLVEEAVLLERSNARENRFKRLLPES